MKASIVTTIVSSVHRGSCEDKLKHTMPAVLAAVDGILARVDYGIYIRDLEQKKIPFIARRIILENSLLANCSYLPKDQKFDDKFLNEDHEPSASKMDRFEPTLHLKPNPQANLDFSQQVISPNATISEAKSPAKNGTTLGSVLGLPK